MILASIQKLLIEKKVISDVYMKDHLVTIVHVCSAANAHPDTSGSKKELKQVCGACVLLLFLGI